MRNLFWYIGFCLLAMLATPASAQVYGNEWINYNQTYFKFRVFKDSVYRIPATDLFALGMPNTVSGSQLQLLREGEEQAMFVSNNGVLGATDFIEFWATKADGKPNKPLYANPANQSNPYTHIVSDSAYYFLTFDNAANHLRYIQQANNLVNLPVKENYIFDFVKASYKSVLSGGVSHFGQSQTPVIFLTSSQFEQGEGSVRSFVSATDSVRITMTTPYTQAGAPQGFLRTIVLGYSYLNQHRLKLFANNTELADSVYGSFDAKRFEVPVPMTLTDANNRISFKYTPMNTGVPNLPDRYGISYFEFRYARQCSLANRSTFYFELDPKATDYYLELSQFNHGNVPPILYDLTSQQYLIGDIAVAGRTRFLIPASNSVKRLVLHSRNNGISGSVINLQAVTFKNFTQAIQQGNYVMITHPMLMQDGASFPVDEYKQYRSSLAGGAYQPIVVDVNDIYNEFGYGYVFDAQAIKNFLHFAVKNPLWTVKPKHALLIGKGITYNRYAAYAAAPFASYPFYAVPTFGYPASDQLLTDFDRNSKPQLSIGRVPANTASEVTTYLNKIKLHEQTVASVSLNSSDMLWRKKVLHIAGASDAVQQQPIVSALNHQEQVLKQSAYGANVTIIKKGTTSTVEDVNSKVIDTLINSGLGLIQFFGHSSASGMDYNLDFPENYNNNGKFPLFVANGCGAGNMFELTGQKSLGERFVLAPNSGSMAFVASVSTGLTGALGAYTDSLYSQIGVQAYGKPIGEQMNTTVNRLMNDPVLGADPVMRLHAEQIVLNGDPASTTFFTALPDYALEADGLQLDALNITSTLDSFEVKIVVHNLGKYLNDSVGIVLRRITPKQTEQVVLNRKLPGIFYSDTIRVKVPTLGEQALGINTIEVIIDQEGICTELSETNNSLSRSFVIYNDDLVPIYPGPFSIVNQTTVVLKGSTLNPFMGSRSYVFQIDTTETFSSPAFKTGTVTAPGGVVTWPAVGPFKDSTVYYWRTAMDTLYGNSQYRWSTSSFLYLPTGNPGWNQSHRYQWEKNNYKNLQYDSLARQFTFSSLTKKLQVQNVCMNAPAPYTYTWPDYLVKINGTTLYTFGCDPFPGYSSLQFIVIDSLTGQLWKNYRDTLTNTGRFGSYLPCRIIAQGDTLDPFFEFDFRTPTARLNIMKFIDSIPQGFYVMMQPRVCVGAGNAACGTINNVFINQWKSDTSALGPGQSLYHKLVNFGFNQIDSFYKNRPMIFYMRKGMLNTVQQFIERDSTKKLFAELAYSSVLYNGEMQSVKIGPAKSWTNFTRNGYSLENPINDSTRITLVGINNNEVETPLATLVGDTSLAFIDVKQYPYLRLLFNTTDNKTNSPEQLRHWRVHYVPAPEGAVNPAQYLVWPDTVAQGQAVPISIAFQNVSPTNMDSLRVRYQLVDKNNGRVTVKDWRMQPVLAGDTIRLSALLNLGNATGMQTLLVEANPENDQIEQYHPNNIAFKPLFNVPDKKNPLLDVTFDGVHIMERDIVSAKPYIQINLHDENKYLALNDTSLMDVYLRLPEQAPGTEQRIPFDGQVLKFIPASASAAAAGKNTARIEYRPTFTRDGDDYMLLVRAKDKSGNSSGTNAYQVGFRVILKSSVSALLNYPNPFTSSTRFLFTLTGSEVPTQFKIQILAPTGKVVREITQAELGPLRIGQNLTEFRWKGDDQFGQPLGNGVYLYRVVCSGKGKAFEHYESSADKWIEKGFGKLYIMR